MKKGARVRVARGRKSQGVEGTVFWEGPNKFGEGTRLGIKDAGGETHWISAEHVELLDAAEGEEAAEPSAPAGPAPDASLLQKGARVGWDGGAGTIFWIGQNKFGPGLRLGVTGDDEQKHWVDAAEVQVLEEAEGGGAGGGGSGDGGGEGDRGEVIGALPDEGVVFDRDDEDDGRNDLEEDDDDVPF
jgi:hypothetical protein